MFIAYNLYYQSKLKVTNNNLVLYLLDIPKKKITGCTNRYKLT